ncbi:MAG: hypothetical protein K9N46_09435 [Candidatus Marinimicrobia bacterium]|nr:hypothetical protein [Candidatus Neomarinimicrobiota bacterium]MCF7828460.1 hypothetical protein [Candidatus Neomarinimicrobiota bacterium]MCF7880946.1 hypothetical protein [Candidatus Neomarinimicrobiota bacterium]
MEINFPKAFQDELSEKLGILPEDVTDTLHQPDQSETLKVDTLQLTFATKFIPQTPAPYFILAYGQQLHDQLQVRMAWKLSPSLGKNLITVSPIELLRQFALEYGLRVIIGQETRRFYLDETIRIDTEATQETIAIQNPENHEYVEQIIAKTERSDKGYQVKCALALCIDIDRYRTWMANE